ncbi:MAG: T9SS type A sorting domain-containing protein [Candidatus Marinimicrobia bacterium]|nr:T9SS type A sorting domain-containing protein [Candidatus Neomarinimicrobiota bacterium]
MRFVKKLIIIFSLYTFCIAGNQNFRGLDADDSFSGPLPLAFKPYLVANGFSTNMLQFARGEYLIIVPNAFVNYIPDLIQFKRSQGFDVTVATLSETGSTADDIKSYIQTTLNNNPLLEYVLLIGDVDGLGELPSFYYGPENDVSDQKYTHLVGDDNIPDVFIGRFSVDSPLELIVSIQKTINYHRSPLENGDWLDRALVVAGNYSNTVPIPITPVWTSQWVKDILLDNGYSQVDTVFYPPIQYGAPQIQSIINNGVGLINYRGWGDANGWHYPEFHVSDISGLNNGWMTPVFTSFVCNANDFANNVDPCLGEALVRAGTPSVPKGGVAVVGPSDLHTSTKYNNIINVYMYDAMLDLDVLELGPAMLAGQMGLLREFPEQNGVGEAQEFYFHVYNILGDPSLNVHITSPDVFTIDASVSDVDAGYINIQSTNSSGIPIQGAVVAVMIGNELIVKGLTDQSGRFIGNVPSAISSDVEVYLNKPGFVQGLETLTPSTIEIVFNGYSLDGSSTAFGLLQIGSSVDIYPIIKNESGDSLASGTGTATAGNGIELATNSFSYSAIYNEEVGIATSPLTLIINDYMIGRDAVLDVTLSSSSVTGKIGLNLESPPLEISLSSATTISPNSSFTPEITCINHGKFTYTNLSVTLSAVSEMTSVVLNGVDPTITLSSWSEVSSLLSDYQIDIGNMSWGSTATINLELSAGDVVLYSSNHHIPILPQLDEYPAMPSRYGYWAYDNTDDGFSEKPEYNWVELDPNYGGSNGTLYELDDDDHVDIDLPFTFKYFGDEYNSITISSNGWASLIPCDINYFWNYTIPMAMGPKAQLAIFWDDLEVVGNDLIQVYTHYDESNGRLIIEWSHALNNFDELTEETFELILYDPTVTITNTGDGVIEMQYNDIVDIDSEKNFATVGIEDQYQNDGIQYTFNNTYAPGAAPIQNGRVIRYTTNPPSNYQAPLSVENEIVPNSFSLLPAYPNPFNPRTTINYALPFVGEVSVKVYDILGHHVTTLVKRHQSSGTHSIVWNGTTQDNKPVSSGTYFVVLESGGLRQTQKIVLLK